MSWHIGTGLEQHGHAAGVANNSPVGCCLVRGFQRLGMSTKKAPPAGAPFAEPRFMQYRTGTMYVRAIRKKQRQGITMAVVSCLLLLMPKHQRNILAMVPAAYSRLPKISQPPMFSPPTFVIFPSGSVPPDGYIVSCFIQ